MKSTHRKAGRTLRKRLRPAQPASVVASAVKKRGRRPHARLLRELEENLSPTETTDEEEEEEEHVDHDEHDYDEEEPLTDTDGTASEAASGPVSRRSQRSRPLDVDKPLLVILPGDDVAEALGITEEEAEEWLFDFSHDEEEPKSKASHKSGKAKAQDEDAVAIPGVTRISGKAMQHAKGGFKLPSSMIKSSTVIAGTEYDLDSEDDEFLKDLHQSTQRKKPLRADNGKKSSGGNVLPPHIFERMIEVLERELHLARSRQFSCFDIADSKRCHEDVAESAHQLMDGIQNYLSDEDARALQRVIDENQRRPSMAVRDDYSAQLVHDPASQPRPIGRPPGNVRKTDSEDMYNKWRSISNASKSLSPTELERMVPEADAIELLRSIFDIESPNGAPVPPDSVFESVYAYWKAHMCENCNPRLRCFHEFIMENWTPFGTLPFLPDDSDDGGLLKAYSKLQAIRFDLERVRLMLDVVRKREKIKREIIRQTNSEVEQVIGAAKRTQDTLDNCSYRIPDFHEHDLLGDEVESADASDDQDAHAATAATAATAAAGPSNRSRAKDRGKGRSHGTPSATSSTSGWAEEEDRALLLAVARHGIGRWTQIRQDLNFTQTSAQMSQRFSRLARHRMKFIGKQDNEEGTADVYHTKKARPAWLKSLSPELLEQLDNYHASEVWEQIAQRHLEDQRSSQKRSGRPVKYPVVIPVPDHVMKQLQANLQSKTSSRSTHTTHVKRTAPKGSDSAQAAPKKRPRHSVLRDAQAAHQEAKAPKLDSDTKVRALRSNAR